MHVYWYLSLFLGLGCTWATAKPTTTAASTDRITGDRFKEMTLFEDLNQTLVFDLTTNKETIQTETTRVPKIEDEISNYYRPNYGIDNATLTAFHQQMKAIALRRKLSSPAPKRQCGRRLARNARIVGGKETYDGEYPWAVSVRVLTKHTCGGTIINKYWILTAAHCTKRFSSRYFRIRPRDVNVGILAFRYDLDIPITEIVYHPLFGKPRRYSHDLALLKLKRPLKFDTYSQPICLPEPDADYVGWNATAVGWGATKEELPGGEEHRPNVLHKVHVPILNNSICAEWYSKVYNGFVRIYEYQICAGYQEGGRDACQGDSGGPLVTKENDHFTLVGIVSAGVGCAREQLPGIYSKISLFVPWIEEVTRL